MKKVTKFGLLFALILAGCGVKKSDTYKSDNTEVAHIYFGKSDTQLDANDKEALKDLVALFKDEQAKTKVPLVIMLVGHSSSDGSLKANRKVAARRASVVAEYLKAYNIKTVIHALDDPRCGDGAAARVVVARICAESESAKRKATEELKRPAKKAQKELKRAMKKADAEIKKVESKPSVETVTESIKPTALGDA